MQTMAVVKTGGKQYLVKENDEIFVDKMEGQVNDVVELPTLAVFTDTEAEIGAPLLSKTTKATILATLKGDKVRVARFKAKVRYRKVTGFRAHLTKIKITKI